MKELFAVDFRDIFGGLILSIVGTAFILCMLFLANGLVFNLVTSDPEKVKGIIEKSSLYEKLPATIYGQLSNETGKNEVEIPLKSPEVRQIALDVYDPEFARTNIENSIDGFYSWLAGETDKPDATIDFTAKNNELANRVSAYVKKRVSKLPVCSYKETLEMKGFDAFKAKCRPSTVTPDAAEREVKKVFAQSDGLLEESKVNLAEIKTDKGDPLYKNLGDLPATFSTAKYVPVALGIFAILTIVTIFYLSKDRISAYKRMSRLLLASGLIVLLVPLAFSLVSKALLGKVSGGDSAGTIVGSISEQFILEAGKVYYGLGIILVLAAIGLYIYARRVEKDTDKLPKPKS